MDSSQQDTGGLGQSTPETNRFTEPASSVGENSQAPEANFSLPSQPPPALASPSIGNSPAPFLGDRGTAPPPFTIGKPPETTAPVVPPEPIPEEKFLPNRIILIAVAVLVVALVVALWWFFRPKPEQVEPGEVVEPPPIEGPSPTPVIPAELEVPAVDRSPTVALAVSPTKMPERVVPTRVPPTPIPTVPETPLPDAGNVGQTLFMVVSGVGAILAGLLFLL